MSITTTLSYSGPSVDDAELLERIPGALRSIIEPTNGFVCLDGALHLRGACSEPDWHSLRSAWLGPARLCERVAALEPSDIPFARTTFGDEIVLRDHDVLRVRFDLEPAEAVVEPLDVSLGGFIAAVESRGREFLCLDPAERQCNAQSTLREELLAFWFADAREKPEAAGARGALWFGGDPAFDRQLGTRFGELLRNAEEGGLDPEWSASPRDFAASVLVLDQLPRNLRRGTAASFALDPLARELSHDALARGVDQCVHPLEAAFLYLPLEHSEDLHDQRLCVSLFEALAERADPSCRGAFEGYLDYARRHRDVIERFGRFPHRNATLERQSTAEEAAFLEGGGDSFGSSTG